jgi:hypothetical protein
VRSAAATGKIISRADAWARDIGISSVGLWKRIKAWEAAVLPLNYARELIQ